MTDLEKEKSTTADDAASALHCETDSTSENIQIPSPLSIELLLEQCTKERQEYLEGWQRMRADVVNIKRTHDEQLKASSVYSQGKLIEDLIPALDTFTAAFSAPTWSAVDSVWRTGIEYIYQQLIQTLLQYGVTTFGAVGDTFSTELHEAVAEEQGIPGTIVRVARSGYKHNTTILRHAQVVVGIE
jgi:molecular chaperone GrpE